MRVSESRVQGSFRISLADQRQEAGGSDSIYLVGKRQAKQGEFFKHKNIQGSNPGSTQAPSVAASASLADCSSRF